jgi:hypothetical protein
LETSTATPIDTSDPSLPILPPKREMLPDRS